ncbi:flagellar hook-associated protein FlgL [Desulfosporosinus sp. BG]|uniref:flagellar hook-associated protein FlgL n=1 Tax=Desulfosporosinus sp. BG TaxID=1633135 RepID=UPI00083BA0CB|nr:flagellar hook-associated protein FlgL [Desulfosporosinus sp. BG]ODA42537.1 Flagellar hook-associated protein FlgL [Desulfosporosinus sp. BG]
MRVTNNMLSQNVKNNIETSNEKMLKLQDQSSSGLGISKPSDDPSAIQRIIRLRNSISNVAQYQSNASEASSYMSTIDGALGEITSQLQRVRELAAEGANGTSTPDDKADLALEVSQISKQLGVEANTQVGSKYVFSGTATNQKLVNSDGTMNSSANSNPLLYQVGSDISINVSIDGPALFGDSTDTTTTPPTTTKGIFTTLNDLSDALKNGDATTISGYLDKIDASINSVIAARADLGARMNRMTALQGQLGTTSANLQKNLSTIQNVDIESTIISYTSQQNVYQAALAVGAKIIQRSLVDYLS